MSNEIISTADAPESAAFSQAVRAGNTIYVSGTTGVEVSTGVFAGDDIHSQTRQALLNCQAILRAAGAELSDVAMVHVLLLRSEDADGMTEVMQEFWPGAKPARCISRIGVDRPGLLVSLALTAVLDVN